MKVTDTSIIINNPRVVGFFQQYPSPAIAEALDDHVLSFVRLLEETLKRQATEGGQEREKECFRRALTQFQDQQSQALAVMLESVEKRFQVASQGLSDTIMGVLSRLDVATLTDSLSNTIKSWMDSNSKQSALEMELSMSSLQERLAEHLRVSISQPLDYIKNQLPETTSRRVHDDVVVLEKGLQTLQGSLDSLVVNTLEKAGDHKALPHIVKETVTVSIKELATQVSEIKSVLNTRVAADLGETAASTRRVQTETELLREKVEALEKQLLVQHTKKANASSKQRGVEGESFVFDQLSERLMERDGYSIEVVAGQAHAADFLVKRQGYPHIRLDSKAYGKETKEKVRSSEVRKFRSDLEGLGNCHGVMVSLHSGIVGMAPIIDLQQLPNGAFAIYLSNTGEDIDPVLDALALLYKLHEVVGPRAEDANELRLSAEAVGKIRKSLGDFGERLQGLRVRLKEGLNDLEYIHTTLMDQVLKSISLSPTERAGVVAEPNKCTRCEKVCKTGQGLIAHQKHCKGTG